MYWTLLWQTVLIVLTGTFLLRVAGRKSISQMTYSETVIMIALGALLIEPVAGKGLWTTFFVGGILVAMLVAIEYVELKSDLLERIFTGQAKVVIENGQIHEANLAKMRLTVDHLEIRLRQVGVSNLSDIQTATLEVNGELGYELKEHKKPATKEDIQRLEALIESRLSGSEVPQAQQHPSNAEKSNIFTEVAQGEHRATPPKHLQ